MAEDGGRRRDGTRAARPAPTGVPDELALARAAHSAIAGDLRSTRQRIESWGHDARNSLTAMWAAASLLERHADVLDPEERRSIAASIGVELGRLRDLLEAAAVDPPQATPIAQVVSRVAREARAGGALVRTTIVGDAVAVARRIDVADAIRHLLDDVALHAPDSTAVIDVRTDDDAVVIAIGADAPGAHGGPRVPVVRERALTSTTALVEALGGTVAVDRPSQRNARVRIVLPRAGTAPVDEPTIVLR